MSKKKTELITLRLTKADKEQIKAKAKQAGMTVTDYLVTSGLGKEIQTMDGLRELAAQVKGVGRNLNQLTTLANMGRVAVARLDEVEEVFGSVCAALLHLTEGK